MANAIQLTTEQIEIVFDALATFRGKTQTRLNETERTITLLEALAPNDKHAKDLPRLYEKRAYLTALIVDIINTDTEVEKQAF